VPFFDKSNKEKMVFSALSIHAKKAIVWRWAIESFDDCFDSISHLISDDVRKPCDISDLTWGEIIALAELHYNDVQFHYSEISVAKVKNILLSEHEEISSYRSWKDYSEFYRPRVLHSNEDRWPCLAPVNDPLLIEDGWNRLHSYVASGHSTIPMLGF
jgi:hypothetical protein